MQKIYGLVFAICLCVALSVTVEAYEPMLVEGRVWELSDPPDHFGGEEITYTVRFDGGKRQAHDFEYFVNSVSPLDDCSGRYRFMSEEDGVVYLVRFENGIALRDTLLDFRYTDGDKIYFPGFGSIRKNYLDSWYGDYYYIATEDSINVNGREYRRVTLNAIDDSGLYYFWVEGIGANIVSDILYKHIMTDDDAYATPVQMLKFKAVYEKGECIFSSGDFVKESVGMQRPETNPDVLSQDLHTGIYDLQGRRLEGIGRPGVYIVNGVKTLVR